MIADFQFVGYVSDLTDYVIDTIMKGNNIYPAGSKENPSTLPPFSLLQRITRPGPNGNSPEWKYEPVCGSGLLSDLVN